MAARTLTAALAALLVTAPANAQVAQYVVTALPDPPGGAYFNTGGVSINNAGQVAANIGTTLPLPPFRAARFTPGMGTVDLGSLFPNGTSQAEAINAAGQVVGRTPNAQGDTRAFRYTDGVGMVDLGVLPGDAISFGFGINDAGVVVGSSFSPGFERPFRYTTTAGMTNLGLPLGADAGRATAINNTGEVVVIGGVIGGPTRTFRYTDVGGYQDIGTLGGTEATGKAINASGVVVGASRNTASQNRAFRHSASSGLEDLGTLPGFTDSFANDINAVGDVVGRVAVGGTDRAVLYRNGLGLVDLNTLIDPGSGWTLFEATAINDFGQIVGIGQSQGAGAFLLTPIPEPSALLLASACMAAGAAVRRDGRNGPRGLPRQ